MKLLFSVIASLCIILSIVAGGGKLKDQQTKSTDKTLNGDQKGPSKFEEKSGDGLDGCAQCSIM